MKILNCLFLTCITPIPMAIVGFCYGLYFPWDNLRGRSNEYTSTFMWRSVPGCLLGMVVCSIVFAIAAFIYGLIFSWIELFVKSLNNDL